MTRESKDTHLMSLLLFDVKCIRYLDNVVYVVELTTTLQLHLFGKRVVFKG